MGRSRVAHDTRRRRKESAARGLEGSFSYDADDYTMHGCRNGMTANVTTNMTPRERVLALLDGRSPDRIPTDYWATREFDTRLKTELNCEDDESLRRKLHIDAPLTVKPRPKRKHHADDPQANLWGVRTQRIRHATGAYDEVAYSPLAHAAGIDDVDGFKWPSPDDFDYTFITKTVEQHDAYRAIRSGIYEPFLIYCAMRGMEQAFEDLLVNPDIADAIFSHLFEFHYEYNQRIFEAGRGEIDLTYVAEDLGSQTGPLISIELYRRFLRDNQRKMADLARSYGVHVFYHTDGAAYPFLRDLVDVVGIEVLNPIQWRCAGMERNRLVREFGDRIAFHGAMDNQKTLPFGTVDDVIAEVKENIDLFAGARWFCAPCHNIQSISPTRNIIAMYQAIHEFGKID